MKKKSLFLMIAMLFVAISSWGYAVNETFYAYDPETNTYDESIQYFIVNNSESNLTCGVLSCTRDGDVIIPATVFTDQNKVVRVVRSGPDWGTALLIDNIYSGNVTSLTFSEGFQQFQAHHFRNCTAEKIVFPSTFNYISGENFGKSTNLKEIVLAEGNQYFEVMTTAQNSSCLVQKSDKKLFWLVLKDKNGNNLTEVTIPEGVKTFPATPRLIADNANQGLKTINLPSTFTGFVKSIVNTRYGFTDYKGLEAINVAEDNPDFCSYEGVVYQKPFVTIDGETKPWGEKLYLAPSNSVGTGKFTVPAGVTEITDISLAKGQMTEIEISGAVEAIGMVAFYGCTNLKKITIPAATTTLGEGFLSYCTRLAEIVVEEGNPYFASYNDALYNADYSTILAYPNGRPNDKDDDGNDVAYTLNSNTKTIGKGCFYASKLTAIDLKSAPNLTYLRQGCLASSYLKSLLIPNTVKLIEYSALNNINHLESVEFENNDDPTSFLKIENYALYMSPTTSQIEEVVFPKQLTNLAAGSSTTNFFGAPKISFAEGSRLTSIGWLSSTYNKSLKEVDLSNCTQLTSIPENFVNNLQELELVKLPASLTTIGANAFFNTPALQTIVFAEGSALTDIGRNTFQNCGIRTIDLPNTLVSLGSEAFAYCENLQSVNFPKTTTSISPEAFKFCDNLTQITVDKDNATYSSSDGMLTSKDKKTLLLFPPGKSSAAGTMLSPSFTTIGEYACYYCSKLTGIIIPKKVTKIGNHAFEFCNNLSSITFLGDVPPADVDADVAADNAKSDYNSQDHRFGNAGTTAREFLNKYVTINLRKNGHQDEYKAENSYWNDAKAYTYSFSAKSGKNDDTTGAKNEFDYLASSSTAVMVLGSTSTNPTTVVPAKVTNPDNDTEYNVAIVGDYAFENIDPAVEEIVFLGPIELIGANAFNNGHLNNVYTENPTSSIKQIIFANCKTVGQNELSTKRFELGKDFGTDEYPEFTKDQKIYCAKSRLAEYKTNMPKFADQIDYKIPGIKIGTKFGTFSREFDVDLNDEGAFTSTYNGNDVPSVVAFTGYVTTVVDEARDYTYIIMRSINCNSEREVIETEGDGTYIPAGTGVLLRSYTADKKTPEDFYYRIGESDSFSAPAENVMMTVTEKGYHINATDGDYTNYVISGGQYKSLGTAGVDMPIHKSYMHIKEVEGSKGIKVIFGGDEDATAIEEINAAINGKADGKYLENGRIVIMKNGAKYNAMGQKI